MTKFKNKYRSESHRMPHWDYSGNGIYFITPVTQNRVCNLGKIKNGKMILSDFGEVVNREWIKSFEIRNELFCDEYIIMPNHLHAIVILDKNDLNRTGEMDGTHGDTNGTNGSRGTYGSNAADGSRGTDGSRGSHVTHGSHVETHGSHVETHGRASLQSRQSQSRQSQSNFIRKPKSISSFIAGFKSAVNSKIDDYIDDQQLNIPKYNKNNHFFQPNYHDHVIRNIGEHQRIKNYIINNPQNWDGDRFNKK